MARLASKMPSKTAAGTKGIGQARKTARQAVFKKGKCLRRQTVEG